MNMNDFLYSLSVMGQGMLGIFVVTLVIIVAIYILGKINTKDEQKKRSHRLRFTVLFTAQTSFSAWESFEKAPGLMRTVPVFKVPKARCAAGAQ